MIWRSRLAACCSGRRGIRKVLYADCRLSGMNRPPHSGHSIRSKSMRRILSSVIEYPQFGQTVFKDAITFSRLIFCLWGTGNCLTLKRRTAAIAGKC
jgi:hypothetical protein